jgi:hypothetical protein
MAGLASEVKQVILTLDEILHRMLVPNVRDVNFHPLCNFFDVAKIPPIFWNQTVHESYVHAEINQATGQIRTDETEATGNQRFL